MLANDLFPKVRQRVLAVLFGALKGSNRRIENVPNIQVTSDERFRNKLVTEGILAAQDGMVVFTRNTMFSSPSMAAMELIGRTANGGMEWKSANGKTLDELKRQAGAVVFG